VYVQAIESTAGDIVKESEKVSLKVSLPFYCEHYNTLAPHSAKPLENDQYLCRPVCAALISTASTQDTFLS
jgi:hypothetical protein